MRWWKAFITAAAMAATPALAQEEAAAADAGQAEVVVTGARREIDGYDASVPVIGLRRAADFAVQQVTVAGDTRDPAKRRDEIYATIRAAIALAGNKGRGIELATGETLLEPLTLANYRDLPLTGDGRPDSERTSFLVKTRLVPGVDAKTALDRVEAFIRAVPTSGRALLNATDDLTLSVVRPDQYRDAIVELIAADAKRLAARFGPDYGAEARGLDRPVEWARSGLTEVFLYLPYQVTIVPGD